MDKDTTVIGRSSSSDICLGDRSVCGTHAKIVFDKATGTFMLLDCSSLTGTYVQVDADFDILKEQATCLKIGRTTLNVKVSQRRSSKSVRDYLSLSR